MEDVYNTIQLDKDIETISEVVDRFFIMYLLIKEL